MSTDTQALRVTCPNCGSDHVYHFRYDRDWGYGGDYLPINASVPAAARPDIDCLYCHDCLAAFDGPAYDKNGNRIDYLGRLTARLAEVEADLERLQKAAQQVVDSSPAKGPLWRGSNEIGELLEAISLAQPQEETCENSSVESLDTDGHRGKSLHLENDVTSKNENASDASLRRGDSIDFPLMARRPEHADSTHAFPRFNGRMIPIIVAPESEDEFRHLFPNSFRIADTDEHGLPVVVREPGMPKGAKYRYQGEDERWHYLPSADYVPSWAKAERIEDYNEQEVERDA